MNQAVKLMAEKAHDPKLKQTLQKSMTVILAQYQRKSHYGLAGFGTAAAYADALGMKDHAGKLHAIVNDIRKGDDYASRLAEKSGIGHEGGVLI